jgi:hypothetical protein
MIWSEFSSKVRVLLTVDAQRKGAGIQGYIDSVILSGVIEVQQYIPSLRTFNRNSYTEQVLIKERQAELAGVQKGSLTGKGKITKAVVLKPTNSGVVAVELTRWDWDKRNSMAMNCLPGCRSPRHPGKITQRAGSKDFYLHPSVVEDEVLVIDWEGVKTAFDNTDDTPYDHRVVKVVSDYVKAHIVREVDKDLQLYAEYYSAYTKERASLYLDEKDMTMFDIPAVTSDHYSTCCLPREDVVPELPPDAPSGIFGIISPFAPTGFQLIGFIPSSPTGLDVFGARKTLYHSYALSDSDPAANLPQFPTNIGADVLSPATGLSAIIGVPAPATGLAGRTRPSLPTGIRAFVAPAPAKPTGLWYVVGIPNAPTGLGWLPLQPTQMNYDFISDLPAQPTGISALVSPTGLTGIQSNSTGTIVVPNNPTSIAAVHDGAGGAWIPEQPTGMLSEVEGGSPAQPTGLQGLYAPYVIRHYKFNPITGLFELQAFEAIVITENGGEWEYEE